MKNKHIRLNKVDAAVILPLYNEAENIDYILEDLKAVAGVGIIAVNDCSSDNTLAILNKYKHLVILDLSCNLGVGGAVQTGLKYARENGFEYIVKFDGDGQHRACDIVSLLKPLQLGEADIVIGSRFLNMNEGFRSTIARRIGIKVFQVINYIVTGENITDNTSGFRAYNRKAIDFMADKYPSFDYPEPEEVVLAIKNGLRVKEVAVEMRERQGGISSISTVISVYYMLKVILSIMMIAIRPRSKF